MSERRRSIARIVALQDKVETLAAVRLAAAEASKAAIVASRDDLAAFVTNADLTGALAVHAIASARRLAAQEAEAETARTAAATARQAAERRRKLAERVGEAILRDERTAADRRALETVIEAVVARGALDGDGEEPFP